MTKLHLAGLPGSACPAVCEDYVQHLLPRDLAAGAPVAGTVLGWARSLGDALKKVVG